MTRAARQRQEAGRAFVCGMGACFVAIGAGLLTAFRLLGGDSGPVPLVMGTLALMATRRSWLELRAAVRCFDEAAAEEWRALIHRDPARVRKAEISTEKHHE
jgi:hypothetical protein